MSQKKIKVSIIVPVFNEEDYIEKCVNEIKQILLKHNTTYEIIVSDNNSNDNTRNILKKFKDDKNVVINLRKSNNGKGANLRDGIKLANGEIIIFQDADLEYETKNIINVLECFEEKKVDVVLGSRFLHYKYKPTFGFLNYHANKILTLTANLLFNRTYSDIETGLKGFNANFLKSISLVSNGFEIENEITAKISKKKARVIEIPAMYYPRTYEEGKKVRWWHFFTSLFSLIFWRFKKI